jgi:hypothetical protein
MRSNVKLEQDLLEVEEADLDFGQEIVQKRRFARLLNYIKKVPSPHLPPSTPVALWHILSLCEACQWFAASSHTDVTYCCTHSR